MAGPKRPDPQKFAQANAAFDAGNPGAALAVYEALLKKHAKDADLLQRAGVCHGQLGRYDRAADYLGRAARSRPNVSIWVNCGVALQLARRFDAAHRAFDQAIRLEKTPGLALSRKGNLLMMQGRAAEAYDLLEDAASADDVDHTVADVFGRAARSVGKLDEGLAVVGRVLDRSEVVGPARAELLFRRGHLADARGDYDDAFAAFDEANAIKRTPYDAAGHSAIVDATIERWSRERHQAAPRASLSGERFVLIVGMPRSGTSLVEQILSAHPAVFGAGEAVGMLSAGDVMRERAHAAGDADDGLAVLDQASLDELARIYHADLERGAKRAKRITDKLPSNVLRLGLADLMLPGVKVVHCRRDPRDTCLSCYFTDFGAPNPYAYDLAALAAFHRDCDRMAGHWAGVIDAPILDVAYEALVEDPEGHARRLVEFAGLPWDDACARPHESDRVTLTASSEQVREPVYRSSSGRWKNYERHLGPLASLA